MVVGVAVVGVVVVEAFLMGVDWVDDLLAIVLDGDPPPLLNWDLMASKFFPEYVLESGPWLFVAVEFTVRFCCLDCSKMEILSEMGFFPD